MDLRPCPFCGGPPKPRGTRWVVCEVKNCPGAGFLATPADWNRRAPSPEVRAVVEAWKRWKNEAAAIDVPLDMEDALDALAAKEGR